MIYENQESTTNKNPGYQQMSTPSSFQMITWQNATTTCSLVHLHTLWAYIRGRYFLLKKMIKSQNIAHLHLHFFPPLLYEANQSKYLVGLVRRLSFDPRRS